MQVFFVLCDKALILKVSLTHISVIQKESMSSLIIEVWNKNIFSFAAEMLFLQSLQMKFFRYNGVW